MPDDASDEWDARLAAARAALDETRPLVEYAREAKRLTGSKSAEVAILAGEPALRAASRIGILSGSFNPLTTAHAELARVAMRSGGLDALVWCCAAASIDKESVTRANIADRLMQVWCYAGHEAGSVVALVNRGLYVDQAQLIHGFVAAEADVCVIVGFDKAVQIFDPRYYADRDAALTDLFASARLLVAPRDEGGRVELMRLLAHPDNASFAGRVGYLDVSGDIRTESSTEAREIAAGSLDHATAERLRGLVPPEGFALATTEVPYRAPADEDADAYLWRSRWITELARFSEVIGGPLPALHALVAASLRTDAVGAEIRGCLRRSQESDASDSLVRALADAMKAA